MRSRTLFLIAIGLLILGIALFTFFPRDEDSLQVFPATIHRDCAPWDRAAFTVQVPVRDGRIIDIAIWQGSDIQLPKTFSFPDTTNQIGNASLIHPVGLPEQLSGTVSFPRVDQSIVVEGRFDLRDEAGQQYKGIFRAEWDDQIMLCG